MLFLAFVKVAKFRGAIQLIFETDSGIESDTRYVASLLGEETEEPKPEAQMSRRKR